MKLIDKDTVVTEIERRINNIIRTPEEEAELKQNFPDQYGIILGYRAALSILDKEQDLVYSTPSKWKPSEEQMKVCNKDFESYMKENSMTDKEIIKTVDGIVFAQLEEGEIMVRSHYFKSESLKYLDEVKMIIVKED